MEVNEFSPTCYFFSKWTRQVVWPLYVFASDVFLCCEKFPQALFKGYDLTDAI